MIDLKQLSGIMNTDDPNSNIPAVHHKYALNGRFRGNGNSMEFQGVPGNVLITNNYLPTGSNQCIGSFYDSLRQRIIWFNWNSNSKHGIYQYAIKTKTVSPLLISFSNSLTDILDFDLNFPIPSVVMLYTTEEDGDILHWTDRRNRPMKLNIKDALANIYGSNWLEDYLTVNRPTAPAPPICTYANDNTVDINNFRSTLYQFRYRFWYKDNNKSTWSSYSRLFAPVNPDDLATNVDPHKNNRIDITLNTGGADCIKIEIAFRQSIETTFSDCFLIIALDKSNLSIPNNSVYTYQFFNDSSYPPIDVIETDLLWSNVPQLANTMELLNGNVIVYGATTEGYTNNETLDVDVDIALVDNSASTGLVITQTTSTYYDPPSPNTSETQGVIFTLSGGLTNVSTVQIRYVSTYPGAPSNAATYTVNPGDTLQDVIDGLQAQFPQINFNAISTSNLYNTVPPLSIMVFYQNDPNAGFQQITGSFTITYSGTTPVTDVNIAMLHHLSKYDIGIVYFDEFDETDGVTTNATLSIETPEVDTTGATQMKIPQITLSINSQPPIWAVKFSIVFTNSLTYGATTPTVSSASDHDADFGYLDITVQQINQNKYPSYGFTSGDRVRIIGKYGSPITFVDVPVVDLVTDPNINGTNRTGRWLKIPYSATVMTNFGSSNPHWTIEIYTPALNTSPDLQVYFEVGQEFPVLNIGATNRAHGGMIQDQIVGTQPAIYTFVRGDFYIRTRILPFADNLTDPRTVWITDHSVSDLYPSNVRNNGRPYIVDESAKNQYYMTRLRWGQKYQQDTNINQTNIFYPLDLDEIDRAKGDIQRFLTEDRLLYVYQNRAVGNYGVYARYIQNNQGNQQLVTTNDIITVGNVNYMIGQYGLGDQYCGLIRGSQSRHYFADPVRGYFVRRSGDGLVPISELFWGQYLIRSLLTPYNKTWTRTVGGNAKIIGCYDYVEEQYTPLLQGGTSGSKSINNYALSFNEKRNGFASFYDFNQAEWLMSAEDIIYAWHNGQLYSHNNEEKWCNFFGVQYYPKITLVFNDKELIKKVYDAVAYQGNQLWVSPNNGDIATSMINPQTGMQQVSQLKEVDYEIQENIRYAALLRDANSMSNAQLALVEGDFLNGTNIEIDFVYRGSDFAFLYLPYILYQPSPRNL